MSKHTTLLLTAFTVLVAALHTVVGLKCYKCYSTERECSDPFNRTSASLSHILVQVEAGYVCTRIVHVTPDNKKVIERGVKTLQDVEEYCFKNFHKGSPKCSWCDDSDGCNSVPSLSSRTLFNLLLPCVVALIIANL